jgi:O-antigen/teichoic acid export membrane protein
MWLSIEAVLSRGLTVLAMMMAAGALGTVGFGQLSAIQATLVVFSGLLADALRLTVTRQISALDCDNPEIGRVVAFAFTTAFTASVAVSFVIYLLTPLLADHFLGSPTLTTGLRIGIIFLLFEALNGLCLGVLTGMRRFRAMALAGAVSGGLLIAFTVVGAQHGVNGMLWALVGSSAIGAVIRGTMILNTLRNSAIALRLSVTRADLNVLRRFSLPALLTGLCWAPVNWLVTGMLVHSPDGYHELGVLGVANQWFALLLFLPNVVGTVLLPHLSGAIGQRDLRAWRDTAKLGIRTNLLIAVPTTCAVAAFSVVIMSFYGAGYQSGWAVLIIVACAAATASTQNVMVNMFASTDRMWDSMSTQLSWSASYLLCTFIALQLRLGALGVAGALLVAYLIKLAHAAHKLRIVMAHHNP